MNTKIHKKLNDLSVSLMKAAKREDEETFYQFYDELKALCIDNQADETKNHPEQWETLADFTDELEQAMTYYNVALALASDPKDHEFIASINYSMATMYNDAGNTEAALTCAQNAKGSMKRVHDKILLEEIDQLLESLEA
jgi:tetratricopeptide (TPR) repeat protein